jgi:hypothetical protein
MIDFQTKLNTMQLADSEDRALLGSNPSAAVGDGDIDRSNYSTAAPIPNYFPDVLVRKAINPFVRHHSTKDIGELLNPTGLPFGNISGAWNR